MALEPVRIERKEGSRVRRGLREHEGLREDCPQTLSVGAEVVNKLLTRCEWNESIRESFKATEHLVLTEKQGAELQALEDSTPLFGKPIKVKLHA